MNRCNGICQNGEQCKRMLKTGSWCKQHYKGECSICLNNVSNTTKTTKTICGHYFHSDCLNQWCKSNNTCPICRKEICEKREIGVTFNLTITPSQSEAFSIQLRDVGTDDANDIHLIVERFYDILVDDERFKNIILNKQVYAISITLEDTEVD